MTLVKSEGLYLISTVTYPCQGGGMRARPMGAGSSARVVAADVSVSIPSIGLMNAK